MPPAGPSGGFFPDPSATINSCEYEENRQYQTEDRFQPGRKGCGEGPGEIRAREAHPQFQGKARRQVPGEIRAREAHREAHPQFQGKARRQVPGEARANKACRKARPRQGGNPGHFDVRCPAQVRCPRQP